MAVTTSDDGPKGKIDKQLTEIANMALVGPVAILEVRSYDEQTIQFNDKKTGQQKSMTYRKYGCEFVGSGRQLTATEWPKRGTESEYEHPKLTRKATYMVGLGAMEQRGGVTEVRITSIAPYTIPA